MDWPSMLSLAIIIFCLIGVVIFFRIHPLRRVSRIRSHGMHILAQVIELHAEIDVARSSLCYYVQATWVDPRTQRVYSYRCGPGGGRFRDHYPPGSLIELVVDPAHPQHFVATLQPDERLAHQ